MGARGGGEEGGGGGAAGGAGRKGGAAHGVARTDVVPRRVKAKAVHLVTGGEGGGWVGGGK